MESRITELEIKISYAEDMIDELNHTIFRQQQQIEMLISQMRTLREQMQTSQPNEALSLRDELPPHY
ncbi:SlyX protein [Dechloromonas denitrificans]|uniref:SlyX protein n=1 Tax=Dechloromonas denitrificans TaxID=281362 RepID=A0A133XN24_9RHOO|nr:SlyX family protein [Dechloromonas denitrificans]KXB32338.1 SlyX protein [Dechloromonas denitrificans]